MKFVALISGGKDSIYSIVKAQKEGHELVACVHLGRPVAIPEKNNFDTQDGDDEEEPESYMYQTAASEVVQTLVEECIQVPLIHHVRQGKSVQTSLVYDDEKLEENAPDEVEDLYQALRQAKERFPHIQAVSSGALLSTYQRVRIENVCQRLGLTSLSYLWRLGSQHEILRDMIHTAGLEVVLVRTAAPPGLVPRKHLNRTLNELEPILYQLYDRYRMHVCGEGGEYESLCLYAPGLYKKRLVLDQVEIRTDPHDDGVGVLWIKSCHAEEIDSNLLLSTESNSSSSSPSAVVEKEAPVVPKPTDRVVDVLDEWIPPQIQWLPPVRRCQGGFWHTSCILSPRFYYSNQNVDSTTSEANLAVKEARDIFFLLQALLTSQQCTAQDVGMVHLYLSNISHFQLINQYYRECFGVLLPPSRSCVALGKSLPQGRRVMLDCWVLAGSAEYMRRQGVENPSCSSEPLSPYAEAALANTTVRHRQVLHVQSLSHWAPVCVGPYSQANTLFGAMHFLAGSIGLWPATMTLRETWTLQLEQSWKNLAQILDALDQSSLRTHMLSGLVYIATDVYRADPAETTIQILDISKQQIISNAGVVPGLVDDLVEASYQNDGYEDEETRLALEGTSSEDVQHICPLLVVAIPSMPVGARVEVEIVTATKAAQKCLPIKSFKGKVLHYIPSPASSQSKSWDAGYDFQGWPFKMAEDNTEIRWSFRTLDVNGAGLATVAAFAKDNKLANPCFDSHLIVRKMIQALSNAASSSVGTLGMKELVQIRLYYVSTQQNDEGSAVDIATLLQTTITANLPTEAQPAITVVPVNGLQYIDFEEKSAHDQVLLALQASFLDPVLVQTELWIRQGRPSD